MTWLQRYRIQRFMQDSIWILPMGAIVGAIVLVRTIDRFETSFHEAGLNAETARAVLATLAGAMFTFIVFVSSSLLLVVQLASAQMTPRAIATIFRDRITRISLAIFVFAFAFALAALLRTTDRAPAFLTRCAGWSCVVSVGVFLILIDHTGKMLRAVTVCQSVAEEAHRAIVAVYPDKLEREIARGSQLFEEHATGSRQKVLSDASGVVMAFDEAGIADIARRHSCQIRLVPQVGDFVAQGDTLFEWIGAQVPESELRQSIAIGAERTVEQDPGFALRLLVDMACKALSPGINDPTTAVTAIDHIHHLLRHLGLRRLDDRAKRDAAGTVRLTFRTPSWDDFITLGVAEIRHYGADSLQVMRRLHAMLQDLVRTLPEERHDALLRELVRLERTASRSFEDPEDRELANVSDPQGVGGAAAPDEHPPATNGLRSDFLKEKP
jgi:uncharacterized membrane protein